MTPHTRLASEHAQTMAEYVVVLGMITVAILTAIGLLSGGIETSIYRVVKLIP